MADWSYRYIENEMTKAHEECAENVLSSDDGIVCDETFLCQSINALCMCSISLIKHFFVIIGVLAEYVYTWFIFRLIALACTYHSVQSINFVISLHNSVMPTKRRIVQRMDWPLTQLQIEICKWIKLLKASAFHMPCAVVRMLTERCRSTQIFSIQGSVRHLTIFWT